MDLTKTFLCLTLLFGLFYGIESQILETNRTDLPNHGICYSMDIRNHAKNLERLRNCSVIIGSLQIVLMDGDHEFSEYTYPELREITQYLLFYRVKSLRSIGKLFPNLSLIRGQRLFLNYALLIFELPQLTEINLYSLTTIQRGCVRIDKNPRLCFSNTIDWATITNSETGHHIAENGDDHCPDPDVCQVCNKNFCWNEANCQNYPYSNCHKECLNGCNVEGHCYYCKNYSDNGLCVKSCPPRKYFVPATFECVTREFCSQMYSGKGWVFENQCIKNCPIDYKQERKKNGSKTCIYCGSQCNVPCHGSDVQSIEQAQAYKGCHFVNGSLTIKLLGEFIHQDSLMNELEDSLGGIREIEGYLRVHTSAAVPSLNFFKNLSVIHGKELHHDLYALSVEDMNNLRTIWDFDKKNMTIKKGKMFFHNNPFLCMSEIRKLSNQTNVKIDEHEVCSTSNGYRAACHIKTLKVETRSIGENFAIIAWDKYFRKNPKIEFNRNVGYVIHFYRDAIEGETTHRYNTDDCDARGWDYIFAAERDDSSSMQTVNLTKLSPYTKYAVYVQTYDKSERRHIDSNSEEGESEMIFFRTKMDIPPMPTLLEAVSYSSDSLSLYWTMPPKYIDAIDHYTVEIYIEYDNQKWYDMINYCEKDINRETPVSGPTYNIEEDIKEIERDYQESCNCRDETWHKQIESVRDEYEKENAKKLNKDELCTKRLGPGEIGTYEDFLRGLRCGHVQLGGSGSGEGGVEENEDNRIKREVTKKEFDIRKLLGLDESDLLKHPTENITLNDKFQVFTTNFSGSNRNFTISNLKHFSKYVILMVGCTKKDGYKCSATAVTTQRTLNDPARDQVVEFIVKPVNSSTIKVSWKPPKEPNGAIFYYVIQYRMEKSEFTGTVSICISNYLYDKSYGQFNVLNLVPGEYFVRIRVGSMGSLSDGSDWQKVYVAESHTIIIVSSILGVIVAVSVILVGVYWWYKKKEYDSRQEEARNLITPPEVRPSTSVRYTVRRRYEDEDDNNPIQLYNPEDDEE